ncbi:hypothetical protein [Terrabacter terrigena]|uniref:Uncharacterized protein n=1 Tax=Terrabacter terrigena TaxID=574718 RepID=A0ABW3N1W0_9MICO
MDARPEYRRLDDPADTLTDIDRLHPFVSGLVVVASVDLEQQVMLAAAPLPEEPSGGWDLHAAGCALTDVALALLPSRPPGRRRRGALITVVCRRAPSSRSAVDEWWAEAWIHADPCIDAAVGQVFAVTPSGWHGVGDRRAGVEPRLRPRLSLVHIDAVPHSGA